MISPFSLLISAFFAMYLYLGSLKHTLLTSCLLFIMIALSPINAFILPFSLLSMIGKNLDHIISRWRYSPLFFPQSLNLDLSQGEHHAHTFGYTFLGHLLRFPHYILSSVISPLYLGDDKFSIRYSDHSLYHSVPNTKLVVIFRGNGWPLDSCREIRPSPETILLTMPQPCSHQESLSFQTSLIKKILLENPNIKTIDFRAHSLGVAQALSVLDSKDIQAQLNQSKIQSIHVSMYAGFKSMLSMFSPFNVSKKLSYIPHCLWGGIPFVLYQWNYRNQKSLSGILNAHDQGNFGKSQLVINEYYCPNNQDEILGANTHILSDSLKNHSRDDKTDPALKLQSHPSMAHHCDLGRSFFNGI